MTDSTLDDGSGDGGLDFGPSIDELFGDLEPDDVDDGRDAPRDDGGAATIEDRTATDVFAELRAEASDGAGADDVLADESPEDIIDRLDEDDGDRDAADDAPLVDEAALDDLLLTGRRKEDEFLWVDSGESDAGTDDPEDARAPDERAVESDDALDPGEASASAVEVATDIAAAETTPEDAAAGDDLDEDATESTGDGDGPGAVDGSDSAGADDTDTLLDEPATAEPTTAGDASARPDRTDADGRDPEAEARPADADRSTGESRTADDGADVPEFVRDAPSATRADPSGPTNGDEWQLGSVDRGQSADRADADRTEDLVLDIDDEADEDEDDESGGGFLAWLRSKLGGLF